MRSAHKPVPSSLLTLRYTGCGPSCHSVSVDAYRQATDECALLLACKQAAAVISASRILSNDSRCALCPDR